MSSENRKNWSRDFPLGALFFLCFLTVFLCHTRLTISKNPQPETLAEKLQENWTVWNYKKANVCGLFLKAVIMVSSPIFSLASTSLLLVGIARENLYFFLPWLLLTFRGLVAVRAINLLELFRAFSDGDRRSAAEWTALSLYLVVIVIDAAECFCFREVFHLFKRLWVMDEPSGRTAAEKDKEISHLDL